MQKRVATAAGCWRRGRRWRGRLRFRLTIPPHIIVVHLVPPPEVVMVVEPVRGRSERRCWDPKAVRLARGVQGRLRGCIHADDALTAKTLSHI